jgi:cell division protein FtsI (penicillin-binding protein 3)
VTFGEAMEVSSNIVMAKVSDRIGAETLFRTARDFGFGTETGVELPGEISGELKKPTEWWGTTLNSIAYGYDVGVTPIQLAAAYAVIANGGILYQPTILERELGDEETGTDIHPTMIRRAISQKTAKIVADFLIGVVEWHRQQARIAE